MKKCDLARYLASRGVMNNDIEELLLGNTPKEFKMFSAGGIDFLVNHLFDSSETAGYGIEKTNHLLRLEGTQTLAVGLVEGDDVICVDIDSGQVFIWMIQTGVGERILVADSITRFMDMCSVKTQ